MPSYFSFWPQVPLQTCRDFFWLNISSSHSTSNQLRPSFRLLNTMKEKGVEGIGRSKVSSHPFSPNQQPQLSSQFSRYLRNGSFQARFICSLVLKVLQNLSCLCVSPFALLDVSYMHTHPCQKIWDTHNKSLTQESQDVLWIGTQAGGIPVTHSSHKQ